MCKIIDTNLDENDTRKVLGSLLCTHEFYGNSYEIQNLSLMRSWDGSVSIKGSYLMDGEERTISGSYDKVDSMKDDFVVYSDIQRNNMDLHPRERTYSYSDYFLPTGEGEIKQVSMLARSSDKIVTAIQEYEIYDSADNVLNAMKK